MEDFTDLQRLLRLKSHEAPPPDFMEEFLLDFHRRQRAELLKRPLWRLAVDRMEAALSGLQLSRYAYAGACGAILVFAGFSANRMLATPPRGAGVVASASALGSRQDPVAFHSPAPQVVVKSPRFNIYGPRPSLSLAELDFDKPRPISTTSGMASSHPRYVLDTRPVSYEQPDSL